MAVKLYPMNQNQTLNAKYFGMFHADYSNSSLQKQGFMDAPFLIYNVYYQLEATYDGKVIVESQSKSLWKNIFGCYSRCYFLWIWTGFYTMGVSWASHVDTSVFKDNKTNNITRLNVLEVNNQDIRMPINIVPVFSL